MNLTKLPKTELEFGNFVDVFSLKNENRFWTAKRKIEKRREREMKTVRGT